MTEAKLTIEPPMHSWGDRAAHPPSGELCGRSQHAWRKLTRSELGLATDRPIIATGHQTLLWHPGILAKYIAMDAAARARQGGSSTCSFATANLIVDQHVGEFGVLEVPVQRADDSLDVARIDLAPNVRPDVPMALHDAFDPAAPGDLSCALDSVREGVRRVIDAIRVHRDAPNAAIQMARALADLMQRWVGPTHDVTASALCETTLARTLMQRMADQPRACIEAYNRAVAAVPEAGIPPLAIEGDEVEVPLWRIGADGVRVRASISDVREASSPSLEGRGNLLPRALFMTALVRLGMCDFYIHGTGGAVYDRAMELWVRDWLGVEVAPKVVVTADLHLPLLDDAQPIDVEAAKHEARHLWHDPEGEGRPSSTKREMLEEIARLPRNSAQRSEAFFRMHKQLETLRATHRDAVKSARERAEQAAGRAADAQIALRRDWAFPLYPEASIDSLAEAIRASARAGEAVPARR